MATPVRSRERLGPFTCPRAIGLSIALGDEGVGAIRNGRPAAAVQTASRCTLTAVLMQACCSWNAVAEEGFPMATTTAGAGAAVHQHGPRPGADVDLIDQVAALKTLLGTKLMSLTMGVDPVTVDRWIAGQSHPRLDNEKRIRATYQVYELLKGVEASPTIRAWFMGMNPQLDDRSPSETTAEGDLRAVLAAARAFRAGS